MDEPGAGGNPTPPDIPQDSRADTRWLSYRELAEILAPTKLESVVRLVRRKGWPKRDSNSGVRVAVPADVLADMQARRKPRAGDVRADIPTDIRADMGKAVAALEAAITVLQEQLARANEQAAGLRAELAAVRTQLDQAKAEAAEQRSRADRAQGTIDGLKAVRAPRPLAAWLRSVRAAFRP